MANTFTGLVKSQYTKTVQALLEERLIGMDICTMRNLETGNTLNNPRWVYLNTDSYTKYTDVTDQDLTYSNEQLVINQTPIISFVYDEVDQLDNSYDVIAIEAPKAAYRLKISIEWNIFNEYSNAGTTQSAVVLSTSNTVSTYGDAYATLLNSGVDGDNIVTIVDPFQMSMIGQSALWNTFQVADASYKRGYKGEFQNTMLYVSTNLTATASLALATNPTEADTVTINGVVFTFNATPSGAGSVDIGANAAASVDNLVAAINGGAGAGTTYIALSASDRAKLEGITATDNTTAIGLESKRGYKVLSSSLTAAGDKWGAVTIYNLMMEKWAIDLAIQKNVTLKVQDVPKQLWKRFMTWTRYGLKTFTEGAEKMLAQPITAQAAES